MVADWFTWRAISSIDEDSSSAAAATVCTLPDACSEAAATMPACRLVSPAVADIEAAVACISCVALPSCARTSATALSKSRVSASIAWPRRSRSS